MQPTDPFGPPIFVVVFFFFVSLLSSKEIVFLQRTYKMTRFIVSNPSKGSIPPLYVLQHLRTFQSPKEAWCQREEVHYQMTRLRPLTRSHLSRTRFENCTHCSFWWESVHSAEDDQYCQEERRLRGGKESQSQRRTGMVLLIQLSVEIKTQIRTD